MSGGQAGLPRFMTTVGFIGSGMIGGTVARLSVAAGHQVVLSNSRGPATLADLAAGLGPLARAGSGQDAAAQSDIVVVSIPFRACQSVPAVPLDGKLVLDTCNYYPERDGHIGVLDDGLETSSELLQQPPGRRRGREGVQQHFLQAPAVAQPRRGRRPVVPADRGRLARGQGQAARYLDSIGYGSVDAGALADSWRQEPGSPVYGPPYGSFSDESGHPAGEDVIREALLTASR